jgi:hypothetical protein
MKKLGWILSVVFMFVTGLYLASITHKQRSQLKPKFPARGVG